MQDKQFVSTATLPQVFYTSSYDHLQYTNTVGEDPGNLST